MRSEGLVWGDFLLPESFLKYPLARQGSWQSFLCSVTLRLASMRLGPNLRLRAFARPARRGRLRVAVGGVDLPHE